MIKVHNNPSFAEINSFEDLFKASENSRFQIEPAINEYTVNGPEVLNANKPQKEVEGAHPKEVCSYLNNTLQIPDLSVYTLNDVKIFPGKIRKRNGPWHSFGQLILDSENNLFSESYGVMDGGKTLPQDLLHQDKDDQSLYLTQPATVFKRLEGTYIFLGSMHDHFGHFLVEGLSRLWILKEFKLEEISLLKFIIYEPGLIPPATKMLEYLGIKKSQIVFLDSPCIVEKVLAPSVGYRTHFWARDCMNYVYDAISKSALEERPHKFKNKVFLSRNHVPSRRLTNEQELENLYRDAGYWVFRPEDIPIGDQIRIAANADCIAGCTGSNMYLAMFQKPGGINHLYAPYDFNLKDDAMISKMRKSNITYILGTALKNDQWDIDILAAKKMLGM